MEKGWRTRYWIVFGGQALSQVGSAISQFVLLWWITTTTKDISSLAIAGIFALLPQALIGPFGGICADRYSRRVIMIVADLITALCMIVLIVLFATNSVQLWHVYLLLFVRSSMQAFQGPASQSSTVMLVPKSFVSRAAGLNQSVLSLMTVAAAPVGAVAISLLGIHWALMIDVITALTGIIPLFFYKIPQPERIESEASFISEFREGVKLVWSNIGLRHVFYIEVAVVLIVVPCFTLVPLLITEHFKGTVKHVALVEGLSGVGMLIGAGVVAYLNLKKKVLPLVLGLATSCFAIGFTALMPSNAFPMAVFFWFVSGVAYTFGSAPMTVILQTSVPPAMQGRVFALMATVMGVASPIGLSLLGPIGSTIGVRGLFVSSGLLCGCLILLGLLSRHLRTIDLK